MSAFGKRPPAVALCLVALVTALRMSGTVDSDVSWQLWIAHHLRSGAQLYRDIVETNPPLWFWMAVPVDWMASMANWRVEPMLVGAVGLIAGLSLIATATLTQSLGRARGLFLAFAAIILTGMPWMHVGQREQIVLIASLPYAALVAARRDGRSVPPATAAAIGLGAGLAFALKHYFLLAPLLLELWLLAGLARRWRPVRAETIAIGCVGILYATLLFALDRDFLTQAVPLIRLAYGVTGAPRALDLFQPAVIVGVISLIVVLWITLKQRAQSSLAPALAIAAVAFGAAYFLQAKGWPYHAVPLTGCAAVALAAALCGGQSLPRPVAVGAPTLLLLPFFLTAGEALGEDAPTPDLRAAIAGVMPGTAVGFIATDPALGWTVTLQRHFRYASRYNGFWMMRAVVANEQRKHPDPALAMLGRRVVTDTVVDFRCIVPKRIIVARPRPGEDGFDILPFFERDPNFRSLLGHYRRVSRTTVETYELAKPLPPVPASSCRKGV